MYERGESGPVLLLLHGGGHSGLSWAVFAVSYFIHIYRLTFNWFVSGCCIEAG